MTLPHGDRPPSLDDLDPAALAQELARALRERSEIDITVGIFMGRYAMSDGQARTLLNQLALHDEVDQVTAARSVSHPDAGQR